MDQDQKVRAKREHSDSTRFGAAAILLAFNIMSIATITLVDRFPPDRSALEVFNEPKMLLPLLLPLMIAAAGIIVAAVSGRILDWLVGKSSRERIFSLSAEFVKKYTVPLVRPLIRFLDALAERVARVISDKFFDAMFLLFERIALSNASQKKESSVVAENYLREQQRSSLAAVIGLGSLITLTALQGQITGAIVLFCICFVLAAHIVLTRYRVGRGLFGANAQEAFELITFIVEHARTSGRPPGSQVSHAYSEQTESAQETAGDTAVARP